MMSQEKNLQRYFDLSHNVFFHAVLNGTYGVDIFFILSGYLIMSILLSELAPLQDFLRTQVSLPSFLTLKDLI